MVVESTRVKNQVPASQEVVKATSSPKACPNKYKITTVVRAVKGGMRCPEMWVGGQGQLS